jgi:hypothetical protein
MTAIDDNTLVLAGYDVYSYDITGDTTTTLFTMPTGQYLGDTYTGYCFADIIYNPVTQELAFGYKAFDYDFDPIPDSKIYVRFTDLSGNLIAELNTYDYGVLNPGGFAGLFTYNQILYMTTSDGGGDNNIYEISLETMSILLRNDLKPTNSSIITLLEGATTQVQKVDWPQPPVFEF